MDKGKRQRKKENAGKRKRGVGIGIKIMVLLLLLAITAISCVGVLVWTLQSVPFEDDSFDAVICANSFHHYPNPQDFFNSTYRVLRKGGRLILRDYTSSNFVVWLMNHLEMPLANLFGHGDVKIHKPAEFITMAEKAGFTVLTMEKQKGFRAHLVARK